MTQRVILILCGLPFAGKTTLAKLFEKKGFVRITLDETNSEFGLKFSLKKVPKKIVREADAFYFKKIEENVRSERDIICDSTAHLKSTRDRIKRIGEKYNAKAYILYIPTSVKITKKRWMENKKIGERQDIREEDFDNIISHFEYPTEDEHVFTVDNQHYSKQTIENIIKNL